MTSRGYCCVVEPALPDVPSLPPLPPELQEHADLHSKDLSPTICIQGHVGQLHRVRAWTSGTCDVPGCSRRRIEKGQWIWACRGCDSQWVSCESCCVEERPESNQPEVPSDLCTPACERLQEHADLQDQPAVPSDLPAVPSDLPAVPSDLPAVPSKESIEELPNLIEDLVKLMPEPSWSNVMPGNSLPSSSPMYHKSSHVIGVSSMARPSTSGSQASNPSSISLGSDEYASPMTVHGLEQKRKEQRAKMLDQQRKRIHTNRNMMLVNEDSPPGVGNSLIQDSPPSTGSTNCTSRINTPLRLGANSLSGGGYTSRSTDVSKSPKSHVMSVMEQPQPQVLVIESSEGANPPIEVQRVESMSSSVEAKAMQRMKDALQSPIYFNGESSNLTLKAAWQLEQAAEVMKEFPMLPWRASSYTGPPGGKFGNANKILQLAELRGTLVRETLRKEGAKNPLFLKNLGHADSYGPRVELSVADANDEKESRARLSNVITTPLQFNGESSKVTVKANWQITEIAEVLLEVPAIGIKVTGFSGPPGGKWNTLEKAKELSQLRARSIREALRKSGVRNAIFCRNYGYLDEKGPRVEVTISQWSDEAQSCYTLDNILDHELDFNGCSSNLTVKARWQLEQVAELLKELPETGIIASGYSGPPGGKWNTPEKALQLCQMRCRMVREVLRAEGATNPIFTNAKGYVDEAGPRVVMATARAEDEKYAKSKLQHLLETTHIEFNGESAKLTVVGAWQIEQIAESLKEFPGLYVSCTGYSGPPGGKWNTESKAKELSQLRCRCVRDALAAEGVTNTISAQGMGYVDSEGARVVLIVATAQEALDRSELDDAFCTPRRTYSLWTKNAGTSSSTEDDEDDNDEDDDDGYADDDVDYDGVPAPTELS